MSLVSDAKNINQTKVDIGIQERISILIYLLNIIDT